MVHVVTFKLHQGVKVPSRTMVYFEIHYCGKPRSRAIEMFLGRFLCTMIHFTIRQLLS